MGKKFRYFFIIIIPPLSWNALRKTLDTKTSDIQSDWGHRRVVVASTTMIQTSMAVRYGTVKTAVTANRTVLKSFTVFIRLDMMVKLPNKTKVRQGLNQSSEFVEAQ